MVDYQVHPARQTPMASVATTDAWTSTALADDVVYVLIYPTVPTHVVCNASASPAGLEDGVLYAAEQTHLIECRGQSTMHAKTIASEATGTLYVTGSHN